MMKKTVCIILALILALASFQIAAFADNKGDTEYCNHCAGDVDVIIGDGVSLETAARIKAHFCGAQCEQQGTRGILCTLFGHKLETGTTKTITHKVRATSPRCLEQTYEYEICTRCDYSNYTLISSRYIVCC